MSEEKSRRRTPYPTELRERAVRMVLDHQTSTRLSGRLAVSAHESFDLHGV